MDNCTINDNMGYVVGVVCEFNPFHKGHEWLLQEIRHHCGKDTVILCAMSGDFVQRGEPALFSKYARAEAACRCGADLVAELPPRCSLSSAEGFAAGAVDLLQRLGADTIAFGAETGSAEELLTMARALASEEFKQAVRQRLQEKPNRSYAAAREAVAGEKWGSRAELLEKPNCILALAYAGAVLRSGQPTQLCVIPRRGAGHDEFTEGEFRSGSQLRELILKGGDVSAYVPEPMQQMIVSETEAKRGPVSAPALEQAALTRLRLMKREEINRLPDAADGLGQRILEAAKTEGSLEALYSSAKSKRFALARVRRVSWQAVLGLLPEEMPGCPEKAYMKEKRMQAASCARILALSPAGRRHLKQGKVSLPVIIKTADAAGVSDEAGQMIAECARAHDLYVLAYGSVDARKGGEDWRKGPFILKNDR